jgi:hypothetical protein
MPVLFMRTGIKFSPNPLRQNATFQARKYRVHPISFLTPYVRMVDRSVNVGWGESEFTRETMDLMGSLTFRHLDEGVLQ